MKKQLVLDANGRKDTISTDMKTYIRYSTSRLDGSGRGIVMEDEFDQSTWEAIQQSFDDGTLYQLQLNMPELKAERITNNSYRIVNIDEFNEYISKYY